jgi:hypothetical protein
VGEAMSLIKRIQACGLCYCECQSITFKEAEAIKELVLGEVVKAINANVSFETADRYNAIEDAICIIERLK